MNATPNQPPGRRRGLHWAQVRILYRRELRAALREKSVVLNSILIPVFLYPFILWVAFTGLMFLMGQTQGLVARVLINRWPQGHPALRLKLQRDDQFEIVEAEAEGPTRQSDDAARLPHANTNTLFAGRQLAHAERQVREGLLDAVLEFGPATNGPAAVPENFQAHIIYDQSKERSAEARSRLRATIDEYRAEWLKREARRHGLTEAQWQDFTLASRNVASKRQMGAFVLGMLAPALFIVMVAVGCFYPAVDATAGERERNTWETLMSTAATRLSIVTAKYLYVVTLGGMAGLLNLAAIMLTLRPIFAPLLEQAGQHLETNVPWLALPVAAAAAVLLAGFIAAGMMLFAAFARTFKEGQAMITPFYLVLLLPVVFLQAPGLKLTPGLALVPVANVVLMLREALSGRFPIALIALTFFASVVLVCLFLWLATFILRFEDVMLGSYQGSLIKFLKQKLLARRQPVTLPVSDSTSLP